MPKTFDIVMAVFDVGSHVVTQAAASISGSTSLDVQATLTSMFNSQIDSMGIGELIGLGMETMIINLLQKLQRERDLSYLFIAHDMSVVKYISDRIGVMYLGHLVEEADTDELFENTLHPYTQALLSAVPDTNPHVKKERIILDGDLPSPLNPPSGCVFHTRCPRACEACSQKVPELKEIKPGHKVACLLYEGGQKE